MTEISATQIDEAHEIFATHMGIGTTTWKGIIEYAIYAGFEVINVARRDIRVGQQSKLNDRTVRAIKLLQGPHASTVVKAYHLRRYSPLGKFQCAFKLPAYWLGFIGCVIVALVVDLRESW